MICFKRQLTESGKCLSTAAGRLSLEFERAYGKYFLPGQLYTADDQCKLSYGSLSHYCNGVIIKWIMVV